MKALVISPQPFFTPRGTPLSVYYRALVATELGVNIDFLTYGEGEDVEIPGMRIIRIPRFRLLGNVKTGPSLLKLFLDVFLFVWTVGLLIRNKYDFVHAHEEAVFFCRYLKPVFRFKLLYDMHSSLPQQLTNFQYTQSRFVIGLFKKLEDASIRNADAVITICPDLTKYVLDQKTDKDKLYQIENSIFEPVRLSSEGREGEKRQPLPTDALPAGRPLIVYAGTLEAYQGIDLLINAFRIVHEREPGAFLLIAGGTKEQVDSFQELAKKNGLEKDITFTGRVSPSIAKQYCRMASVLVSPRIKGTNTPLKIYEQLASGIPLVATGIYSHTQVLNEAVSYLVEPTPESMANGIIQALQPDGRRHIVAGAAKAMYERNYSRPIYEQKLQAVLNLVSPQNRALQEN
jgi:glycosyltransferase involved in cell wall biosynthesis